MADSDIPVISQEEADQQKRSGGYLANGRPAPEAQVVDMNTPAPPPLPDVFKGSGELSAPAAPAKVADGWLASNDEVNANTPTHINMLPPQSDVPAYSDYSALDVAAAAFRQSNLLSASIDRFINHPDAYSATIVPGYNPYDNNGIAGYEEFATRFSDSMSPQQTQVVKDRINQERADKQAIASAGFGGFATSLAAGLVDPISVTMMMVPGLGEANVGSRLAQVGKTVATNVAAGEVQQAALTGMQETTKYTDNMLPRIAANALLSGVLGAWAARMPKSEFAGLAEKADSVINGTKPETTTFYHSSPAEFTAFDHSKIGTGEGNQSFSHGIYGAQKPEVAQSYNVLAENKGVEPNLYKFEVKNSDLKGMLDWDKPLNQQPEVMKALGVDPEAPVKLNGIDPSWTGQELHDALLNGETNLGAPVKDKAALADWLTNKGVKGVTYLDQGSRAAGEGTGNVVLYKGTEANITHRNDVPINGTPAVPTESTGGAAAVRGTTLEQESFAKGGAAVAKLDAALPRWLASPTMRVMTSSPVVESRRLIQRLVDLGGGMLKKNLPEHGGLATSTSVEMVVNQQTNARMAQIVRRSDDLFAEHAKEAGSKALGKREFGAGVLEAMSNGDRHDVPQVQKMAQFVRSFLNRDRDALNKIGAPKEGYNIMGAESYAPRVWDQGKITADRTGLEKLLFKHYSNSPKTVPVPEANVKVEPSVKEPGGNEDFLKVSERRLAEIETERRQHQATMRDELTPEAMARAHVIEEAGGAGRSAAYTNAEEKLAKLNEEKAQLKKGVEEHNPTQEKQEGVGPPSPIFREPAEIKADVQDTIDRIQGAVRGTADIGSGVKNPKAARERVLDVEDNDLRPYLSDDFEHVMRSYHNTMMAHLEMHRQFGSVTLENELEQISDAYRVKMSAAEANPKLQAKEGAVDEAKAKLVEQRESDISDLTLMRDRLLGQAGPRGNDALSIVRAGQIARSLNYVRSLGGQLFSAVTDIGRVAMRYGATNTVKRTAQFMFDSDLRNMAKEDFQRLGTALDVVLHTREHSLEGAGDDYSGAVGNFMRNQTAKFTKYSLIAHWDASIRMISAQLEQDAMSRLVQGDNLSAFERGKLAAHGIGDDDLTSIRSEWLKHGSNENGLNRARTELWTNKDAAEKVEQAVQRAASSNAFFIGKGDIPQFADSQFGKFMFQFKGFALGSVERLTLPLAQGLAHGDAKAASGLAMMLSLGGLRYYMKERAAGRQPDMSPGNLASEMLVGSGVLAFLPDMYDPLAAVAHLPRFSKFKDHGLAEAIGGPTFGEIGNLVTVVNRLAGGHMTDQDIHKMRQLLPYQNMFYLNRVFNMMEGEFADAVGAKGAPHRNFSDYFNPAKDTSPQQKAPDKEHFLGIQSIPN